MDNQHDLRQQMDCVVGSLSNTMSQSSKSLSFCPTGRDAEILQLEGIFRRSASGRASKYGYPNLALVGGVSGAGKSTLTQQLRDHLGVIEEELFWICGKFEEGQQQQQQVNEALDNNSMDLSRGSLDGSQAVSTTNALHPFAAIVDAFSQFFQELEEQEPETLEEVRQDILEAVGQQGAVLTAMIPSLAKLVGAQEGIRESQQSELKRFHLVFRQFVQALASQVRTVVIVLDDIHRADAASLDLLHSLLTSELKHVLFIGTFRSDEVDEFEEDRFNVWIKSIQATQAQQLGGPERPPPSSISCVTMIELLPLDLETINTLVSSAMDLSPDETRSLAHIIYTKTDGNPFYATQYLLYLKKKEGLLRFDFSKGSWEWDEPSIRKEAEVTTTLIDFMRYKISHSEVAPKILPVAACLGAKFRQQTLTLILEDISKVESLQKVLAVDENAAVPDLLKLCEKEGFIRSSGGRLYSFVHDKVQEAALTVHPGSIMTRIRYEAGVSLFQKLDDQELEEKVFVIANLLNNSEQCAVSRFDIAQLNLKAAQKAKQMAAFGSAASYLEYASLLLPKDLAFDDHEQESFVDHEQESKWRVLLLNVSSLGAEVEGAIGRFPQMEQYYNRVFNSSYQFSVSEQLRVQHVMIDYHANNGGQMGIALTHCLEVLELLGCTFPRGTVGQGLRTVTSLLKSKSKKNIPSSEDVHSMGLMSDLTKVEAMRLLDKAATYSYIQADQLIFTMCVTRMVRWTIRYGICDKSAAAYALIGVVLMHVLGDYKAGMLYGELAVSMMHKLEELSSGDESMRATMTHCQSRVTLITNSFIFYWHRPIQEYKNEMVEGHNLGMHAGDTESALWNTYFHIGIKLAAGGTLSELEEICSKGVSEMKALQRGEIEAHTRISWQGILNLLQHSPAEGTTKLSGSAMSELDFEKKDGAWNSKNIPNSFAHMKTMLYAFFGEYEQGAKLAVKQGDRFLVDAPGGFYTITDPFYRGVCLYAAARTNKQRSYRHHAQKCRGTIQSWVKKGNPYAVHQLKLLNAEHEACRGKSETARKLYLDACSSAVADGFIHDAALATERFAQFLSSSHAPGDVEEGRKEIIKSIRLYEKWGAKAKVHQLRTAATKPTVSVSAADSATRSSVAATT